jgi:NADP-dependent 3-hydroxy acid dehydrogenase YdfG
VDQQVVVIVGASSGIGRASALAFADRGARVVCAARSVQALDSLVAEITAAGGTAAAVPTDVADRRAVQALADAAEERFGRIDTWVTAAAVGVFGRVEEISAEEFDRVLRVNFLGHVHGVHAALPALRRAGGGGIIGISSAEGARAVPLQAPYVASKWAVRALYDTLRMELTEEGAPIAVSTILPAAVDTPFFEHSRSKLGAMPKPPPPVYAPELVAEAIVHTAENPRREVPVGGAAVGFVAAQRLSPALTDALLSIPAFGTRAMRTDRPDNGTDNVDAPMDGTGQVHGNHPGHVLRRSPVTELLQRLPRPGELLSAALAAARRRSGRTTVTAEGPATATGPVAPDGPHPPATVDTAPSIRDQPSTTAHGADTGAVPAPGPAEGPAGPGRHRLAELPAETASGRRDPDPPPGAGDPADFVAEHEDRGGR